MSLSPPLVRSDSLRQRYAFKLAANIVGLAGNAVTQLLVPRALGPAVFGQYSYLTNFFTQVVGFFDAGSSIGFYTKLSQRQDDLGLVRFYALLVLSIGAVIALLTGIAGAAGARPVIWPGQQLALVWMALLFAWLSWATQLVGQTIDAWGLTVPGEQARMLQKGVAAAALAGLFAAGWITLPRFFIYQYGALMLLVVVWGRVLRSHGRPLIPGGALSRGAGKGYARELWDYAGPLAATGLATLVLGLVDRWLLQTFAGSVEQGFFGLSAQVGAICFLFTSALTPIWMRETSVAYARGDRGAVRRMFERMLPAAFGVAAFLAVFVAWQGPRVAALVGGTAFQSAGAAVAIMALYPIHQTYGQLSGSLLLVTGQTRAYRNIAVAGALLGLPATLWLLGPRSAGGLALGAPGLALKTVGLQLLMVHAQLWLNARGLGLPFGRLLGSQVAVLGVLVLAGGLSEAAVRPLALPLVAHLGACGAVYAALSAGAVALAPSLVGRSRTELREAVGPVLARLRSRGAG